MNIGCIHWDILHAGLHIRRTLPCQISSWMMQGIAHARPGTANSTEFENLGDPTPTPFTDQRESWHASVNIRSALPCEISAWSVHPVAPLTHPLYQSRRNWRRRVNLWCAAPYQVLPASQHPVIPTDFGIFRGSLNHFADWRKFGR